MPSPTTTLNPGFSSPDATPTPWQTAEEMLENAEVFWLSTVRPDGRPHVTPLLAVWLDDALYFTTGPTERKAYNLNDNPHCILTTGRNALNEGLDIVVEGKAVRATDETLLQRLADRYSAKYEGWDFEVRDEAFYHEAGGHALVFEVAPTRAFGFGKGESFSQTRWSFQPPS